MTVAELYQLKSEFVHVWYYTSHDINEKPKRMSKRDYFKYRNYRVTHIFPDHDNIDPGYTVFVITIQPAE